MKPGNTVIASLLVLGAVGSGVVNPQTCGAEEPTVEQWIAALQDEDWKIRKEATEELERMKDGYAVMPLIETLKDEVVGVRAQAASALGVISDPYAIEPLIGALRDQDSSVRREAAAALGRITGRGFGEDIAQWDKWLEAQEDPGGGY